MIDKYLIHNSCNLVTIVFIMPNVDKSLVFDSDALAILFLRKQQ